MAAAQAPSLRWACLFRGQQVLLFCYKTGQSERRRSAHNRRRWARSRRPMAQNGRRPPPMDAKVKSGRNGSAAAVVLVTGASLLGQ